MSTPWQQVLAQPEEREAFFSLLDEYFRRESPAASSASAAPHRSSFTASPRAPAGLQTVQPTSRSTPPSTSTPSTFSLSSPATSTYIADQALRNPAITSHALRQAGMGPGAAAAASRFGAAHHDKLAPHVARAATSSWAAQNQSSAGAPVTEAPAPRMPPASSLSTF